MTPGDFDMLGDHLCFDLDTVSPHALKTEVELKYGAAVSKRFLDANFDSCSPVRFQMSPLYSE